MKADTYRVRLEDIFEGPMDLLVHLIKKNEVDIYDIPIALITDQYLEYINWMKTMNVDVAGQFLVMAATLMHIKSRMLLPVHDSDEDEDPRSEITGPLQEYLEIKSAAEQLAERELLGDATFKRQGASKSVELEPEEEFIQVGLFELIDAFQRILANVAPDYSIELSAERITIQQRINEIIEILEKQETVAFDELFLASFQKSDIIVTFLALLEMVKIHLVRLAQHVQSGTIRIFYQ